MIKNWMNWEPSLIMLTRNLHVPDHFDKCLFIFRTNKWVFFFWITFWFWKGHIRTVKSFAFTQCWLSTPEYLFTRGRCSIKDQKVPQHMENRFRCEGKSMFQPFIPKQTMNRLTDPTEVAHSADWLHLKSFPHAEDALSRTKSLLSAWKNRFINTWKTGFATKASQCSGYL